MTSYRLTFITPLFSKGIYDHRPEIRPPSIRGQLHWWFRALGGIHESEKAIFGSVHGDAAASKVVVRVNNIVGTSQKAETLPHKRASPKTAFAPGTRFDLHFMERHGGLKGDHAVSFYRAVNAWLLAGTLGLRATRAAGSFIWEPLTNDGVKMPVDARAYSARLDEVFQGTSLRAMLLNEDYPNGEAARCDVSDTIGGRDDSQGSGDLARLHHPLGRVFNGRKTSPLRFRIVKVASGFRITAVWDGRTAVTGNRPEDFSGIVNLLAKRKKRIGLALQAVCE